LRYFFSGAGEWLIEVGQQLQSARGDPAENLAAIVGATFAPDQLLGLQFVQKASDAGRFLDHAIRDVEGRGALLAGAAQNTKHVVLLQGNVSGFDDLSEGALQQVGRAVKPKDGFLRGRCEGLGLADFLAEGFSVPFVRHGADR